MPNFSQISERVWELGASEIYAYASAKIQVMMSKIRNNSDVTSFFVTIV